MLEEYLNKIICGDCIDILKTLEDNSIDAIVTDTPAGISFMGKSWDTDKGGRDNWIKWMQEVATECKRVLKPGGHAFVWAIPRTSHWTATAWENAGFEIRDVVAHVFGSGFPKSLNIGKAVDKLQGNEREVVEYKYQNRIPNGRSGIGLSGNDNTQIRKQDGDTKGTSEWEGWGTALKPAREDWILMRKPLEKGLNIAQNCLKWGVGGIQIDECRVKIGDEKIPRLNIAYERKGDNNFGGGKDKRQGTITGDESSGRFPANLILDGSDEVVELFPQTGKGGYPKLSKDFTGESNITFRGAEIRKERINLDSGSAARFFYCAKSSKRERNCGLDGYLTVKYNECISNNKNLCKEENMVAVQLLQKVISEPTVNFSTGESGESIMVQCHKDSLSTILTGSKRIIGLKIYNLLTHSLTSESTQDAKLETENGGSLAESVADLKRWILTTTKGNQELALGASRVVLKMLSLISEEENWNPATNFHSTVKPIALMEYLIKLVSREGHTILDPFMGSGSTGIACKKLNRHFIGIEKEPEYIKIAEARINAVQKPLF